MFLLGPFAGIQVSILEMGIKSVILNESAAEEV
jgi:hypothetical protein